MVVKRWMVAACTVLATSAATADVRPAPQEPTKTAVLDMGPGCRIQLQVPQKAGYGGIPPESGFPGRGGITIENPLNLKRKTYIEPLYLRFFCYDADPQALSKGLPVRFDPHANVWRRDMQNLYESNGFELDDDFKKTLERGVRFYELRSVNASGFAVTQDDVIGDENKRRRVLDYCLFHDKKAVCSSFDTRMGYVPDIRRNPKNDLTPYALKILRSIEFIDDATTPAAPAASQ
ncbi:hypothetical protein [Caldimonas manganoxidans]|uniref:hypothetical protein n=1 Tax=Caldimonas manganoxidans TaxID=196015 RepID=UPI0012EA9478|nr:hypothetical protein [Caldimonas manganoxidans]